MFKYFCDLNYLCNLNYFVFLNIYLSEGQNNYTFKKD